MSDHITPQEARDMVDAATPGPWKADDETGEINDTNGKQVAYPVSRNGDGDNWIDWATDTDHVLAAAAPEMARMIAGARVEYGVRVTGYPKNIAGWRELFDAPREPEVLWFASEEDADEFGTDRENDGYRLEYGLTRLVIDLGEEEG